jgi:hypothetical protein
MAWRCGEFRGRATSAWLEGTACNECRNAGGKSMVEKMTSGQKEPSAAVFK